MPLGQRQQAFEVIDQEGPFGRQVQGFLVAPMFVAGLRQLTILVALTPIGILFFAFDRPAGDSHRHREAAGAGAQLAEQVFLLPVATWTPRRPGGERVQRVEGFLFFRAGLGPGPEGFFQVSFFGQQIAALDAFDLPAGGFFAVRQVADAADQPNAGELACLALGLQQIDEVPVEFGAFGEKQLRPIDHLGMDGRPVAADGIPGDHHKVAVLGPFLGQAEMAFGHERHVVRRMRGGCAVAAGPDAQQCGIGGMARPAEVVDFAAKIGERGRGRPNQANVGEFALFDQHITHAIVEGGDLAAATATGFAGGYQLLLFAVDGEETLAIVSTLGNGGGNFGADVAKAVRQKGAHAGGRQLRGGRGSQVALTHQVVFGGAVLLQDVVDAVVVGDHQAFG